MRELKFRAWDENHFVYFILDRKLLIRSNWKIQQWTGLKDKNGKEIYEGDIVKIDNEIGVMEFNMGKFMWADEAHKGWGLSDNDSHNEVIGNIYENPELLKENP